MDQNTTPDSDAPDLDLGQFAEWLGLRVTESSEDRLVATWEAQPKMHQPYGIVHGGVHCSVVETLASIAAAVWLGERGQVVGVNNNTDFFKAASEGAMTSTATPLHRGRSSSSGSSRRSPTRTASSSRGARCGSRTSTRPEHRGPTLRERGRRWQLSGST